MNRTPHKNEKNILPALTGIVPPHVSLEDAKEERLRKYEDRV